MSHFSSEGLQAVYDFADGLGMTTFVYCGYTYVMDGGSRAYREGGDWSSGALGCSVRKATEEEEDLWRGFGGATE